MVKYSQIYPKRFGISCDILEPKVKNIRIVEKSLGWFLYKGKIILKIETLRKRYDLCGKFRRR